MTNPLVSDALWEKGHPLLPVPKPGRFRFPGRKRIDDRKALTGDRHSIRPEERHPVGSVAPREGVGFRDDLLASSEGMA